MFIEFKIELCCLAPASSTGFKTEYLSRIFMQTEIQQEIIYIFIIEVKTW